MMFGKDNNYLENKLWGVAIKIMNDDGIILNSIKWVSDIIHSKAGFFSLCLVVWAAVGFLLGLVLGKIYWFFQFY